jgi:hypothetical protein
VLDLGTYYDAAGFPDLTLRMYLDQRDHPEHIPTFPLIVVDEYQDFSPLETAIIDQLGTKSDLLIAGDDDQALYDWRAATADAIRTLAEDPGSDRHPLPYCSRCTSVIVDAVLATIREATAIGKLTGRLDKPFECYMPSKGPDSEAHPKIFARPRARRAAACRWRSRSRRRNGPRQRGGKARGELLNRHVG